MKPALTADEDLEWLFDHAVESLFDVTGASSGFGEMAALELARAGHTVFAGFHSLERSRAKAQQHAKIARDENIDLRAIELNVSAQSSVDAAVAPLGVNEIADAAQQSGSHFPRLFRRSIGLSPYQYVIKTRLEHAFGLLRKTRLPMAEVALRSGFADQSHFCRWVRRAYGASPTQLLARLRRN